jgi:hypothetical protein
MKFRYVFLLMVFYFNTGWADFSEARFTLHPIQPKDGEPYLIEITGEWPSDCHPGEQKPVISDYTGDTALIEFETILVHVTCNDVATPYRVLVDMSDVIDSVSERFIGVEVTVRFGESEFTSMLEFLCICSPVPVGPHINPEVGSYSSNAMGRQGLLLSRQNQRMGVFPLIYDESGSSEWLLGPGGIVEDVFFADLYESTGGQCLGCLPPDEPPQIGVVGKISMLMDSEGIIQVKINDGLFETYGQVAFGYGEVNIGGNPIVNIPDLSGRWAFINGDIMQNTGSAPPTSFLPLVFDIHLLPPPTIGTLPPIMVVPPVPIGTPPPGNASYVIRDMEGENVAEMRCEYETGMVCELNNSDIPDGFEVQLLSLERMILSNLSPISTGMTGAGTAVRID